MKGSPPEEFFLDIFRGESRIYSQKHVSRRVSLPLSPFLIFSSLAGYGVIHSQAVEDAFRAVDRRFFLPKVRTRSYLFLLCTVTFADKP